LAAPSSFFDGALDGADDVRRRHQAPKEKPWRRALRHVVLFHGAPHGAAAMVFPYAPERAWRKRKEPNP
jgi:hypothetical protein